MPIKRHDRNYKSKEFNIEKPDKKDRIIVQNAPASEFPIVGIGSSAGGLEALEKFLKNVPKESGICFVIVQHLDPTQKDFMCELLQRSTEMKVFQIEDRMVVQPNCVYVIPPNKYLAILHGMLLLLDPVTPRGLRMPIDFFFRSLADDRQEDSISVILSGMGTDGTLGLRTIKEKGGVAFVQSSAKFNSMPNSAINEGLAYVVAPAEELPAKIIAYLQHKPIIIRSDMLLEDKDQSGIEKIFILLRRQTGHDFSLYKHSTIYRRVERRMGIHQIKNINIYVKYLQENSQELKLLFNELLIGVTSFFRDPLAWDQLKNEIIKLLKAKVEPGCQLRAWVAGCSTGEEAYSLAILFKEAKEQVMHAQDATLQIFATDMNPGAIAKARKGVYLSNITADVSTARLNRFFIKLGNGYQVSKSIREMIIFAPHNLVMDPPYYRIDILNCRNLLIYMTPVLQKKILPLFHYSLKSGGILFLGSAESIGSFTNLFKPLNSKVQIYYRSESNKVSIPLEFPSSYVSAQSLMLQQVKPVENLAMMADKLILQQYSPAAVVTNEKGDIVYISGRTGKYLEPAAGKANMNIFAMAREGLRYQLIDAFNKALSGKTPVSIKNVVVKSDGHKQKVDFTVQSIKEPKAMRGNVMIVFTDVVTIPEASELETTRNTTANSEYLAKLEQELQYASQEVIAIREEMQSSQEELKSANEELQSMNEELQSTNEELTTSKEEMQSINEELQAVNYELLSKVAELSRTNDEIKNVLNSTEIATVFLDNEMHIKRFTNQMSESSKLIQSDVGRPITDIASDLFYPELEENARDVLRTLIPLEKEVFLHNKEKYFKARIMPYRTMDNKINGVVLTFIDISTAKKLEIVLQESKERFNRVIENSPVTFSNQDRNLRYTWIHNPIIGLSMVLKLGKTDDELFGTKDASEMTELKKSVLLTGNSVRKAIKTSIRGQMFLHDVTVNPLTDESGTVVGVTCVLIDITNIRGLAEFDEARNEGML